MSDIVPLEDASNFGRVWMAPDLFTDGADGSTGRIVPKVDDAILDWNTGFFRVTAVSPDTLLSTLQGVSFTNLNGGVVDADALLGSGPGEPSAAYRVYFNTVPTKPTLDFDARTFIYGSQADHVKVFLGTDITDTGMVISAILDGSGNVVSNNIPLNQITIPGVDVLAIYNVVQANSTQAVTDGEIVSAVIYDSTGRVLSTYKMIAEVTNAFQTNDTSKLYVIGIELLSPYLSVSNDLLLEYPLNVPIQNGALQCRVRYSDGSHNDIPVDGITASLLGANAYVSTILGQTSDLTLVYNLQPNEYAIGASPPQPQRAMSQDYQVTTIASDNDYTVKLMVVPSWDKVNAVWKLDYYLYNLSRGTTYLVTPYITYAKSFNPLLIGVQQNIAVSLNLNSIPGAGFDYYVFLQTFSFMISTSGSNNTGTDFWTLQYSPGDYEGSGVYAVATPNFLNPLTFNLDISLNLRNVDLWLLRLYKPLEALYFPPTELAPPTPTHVNVYVDGTYINQLTVLEALNMFDNLTGLAIPITVASTVRLEFVQKVGSTDYQLATTSMNVVMP